MRPNQAKGSMKADEREQKCQLEICVVWRDLCHASVRVCHKYFSIFINNNTTGSNKTVRKKRAAKENDLYLTGIRYLYGRAAI